MSEFDFDNYETAEEDDDFYEDYEDFDWDAVFGDEEPEFDSSILDEPIGEYEDDEDEEGPSFGVTEPRNPGPSGPGGGHAKNPNEKELAMV